MKIVSWNVAGLRAALKKGLLDWIRHERADVVCLQEIKATPGQVEVTWPRGYEAHWNPAEKKGYSGTLTLVQGGALSVVRGLGGHLPDAEGRVLTVELPALYLVNCYTPNARRDLSRLPYRHREWDPAFRRFLCALARSKPVVFCGDLNVAHTEIDLTHPRANTKNHGFTPEERAGFSQLLAAGFVDTFRALHPDEPGHYSWWSQINDARARNVGWRIDYVGVSAELRPRLREAFIRPQVLGSDHAPVGAVLAGEAAAPAGAQASPRSSRSSSPSPR